MKRIVAGILAHVDAGKTTLSEALLYRTGEIRKLGRVDHGDAFLDTDAMERARGITIFAEPAIIETGDLALTLLDTPGHVDFSAETERTLRVLDYAILVISGSDGVQGHTETLWRLLKRYQVPTFIFINKMDAPGADKKLLLDQLRRRFGDACIDFEDSIAPERQENAAMQDETAMDAFLNDGEIPLQDVRRMIAERKLFPCFWGSALKMEGIDDFLAGFERYVREPQYAERFGARVFKVSHDAQGNRLTWCKVTGGQLKAKMMLTNAKQANDTVDSTNNEDAARGDHNNGTSDNGVTSGVTNGGVGGASVGVHGVGDAGAGVGGVTNSAANSNPIARTDVMEAWNEKADQVRRYSGAKFTTIDCAQAGEICAVTGLTHTFPGEGLGCEADAERPMLQPVLTYTLLPGDNDIHKCLVALRELGDEDPLLHVVWQERLQEVHVQLMGEVQLEIIQQMMHDRFGLDVSFGPGGILYKETITHPVEGVGHFEPLRHYAEVHVLLEPTGLGSGLSYATVCSENVLARNWQRLIMTHFREKEHLGVLTGSPITDMRITLLIGRAHEKHTEGGDFRQSTYRAIRQGLMMARAEGDAEAYVSELRELEAAGGKSSSGASVGADTETVGANDAISANDKHMRRSTDNDDRANSTRVNTARANSVLSSNGRSSTACMSGMSGTSDNALNRESSVHNVHAGWCSVLEPWYRFRLEIPQDMIGRAMSDIQRMSGSFDPVRTDGEYAILTGDVPVSEMRDYAMDVNAYTHGQGRLSCTFGGYRPCHNEADVIEQAAYDPESDLENTPDSVFCAHGAGYPVKWYKVPEFMHLEYAGARK